MPLQIRRRFVLFVGVPGGIADKTFVLCSERVRVPTERVPRVILLAYHLRHFTGGRITRIIFQTVDAIMRAGLRARPLEIGNRCQVITFHIVDDDELVPVAGFVPVVFERLSPDGRSVISAR